MDTQTNNKLIADFIGLESNEQGYLNDPNSMQYITGFSWDYGRLPLEQLRFDVDWNWLMVVIDRIEKAPDYEFFVHILGATCWITSSKFEYSDHVKEGGWLFSATDYFKYEESHPTRIEAVYKTIVEFIKWYNDGKV